jgi:hypothetical protein
MAAYGHGFNGRDEADSFLQVEGVKIFTTGDTEGAQGITGRWANVSGDKCPRRRVATDVSTCLSTAHYA